MRIRIRGKYWSLKRGRAGHGLDGFCDEEGRRIVVGSHITDELTALETLTHELMHAGLPDYCEESIEELAADIAKVLRDCGARVEIPKR